MQQTLMILKSRCEICDTTKNITTLKNGGGICNRCLIELVTLKRKILCQVDPN